METWRQRLRSTLWQQTIKLALGRYKWLNLPDTCDERYLELTLFRDGNATICYDKKKGWVNAQVIMQSPPDYYLNPTKWLGWGLQLQVNCSPKNAVIVYDNKLRTTLTPFLETMLTEIVQLMETKQVNRFQQRIPYLLKGDKQRTNELKSIIKAINNNELAMIVTDLAGLDQVDVLQTQSEFIADKLNEDIEYYWTKIYQCLGIQNQQYKAERMVQKEIMNQEHVTEVFFNDGLHVRQIACKYLNDNFGLNIEVVQNRDTDSIPWYESEMGLEQGTLLGGGQSQNGAPVPEKKGNGNNVKSKS